MKKIIFVFMCVFTHGRLKAQTGYAGAAFNYNSNLAYNHTGAVEITGSLCIAESNWYIDWDFALGQNFQSDFYGRGNIALLLYKSPDWWSPVQHPQYFSYTPSAVAARVAFTLLFPAICPVGATNYFYNGNNLRLGFYMHPFLMDYWDTRKPVTSWTLEGGFKILINRGREGNLFMKVGATSINNLERYKNADKANEFMLTFSLGTLFGID
jgi:hypothetical protein